MTIAAWVGCFVVLGIACSVGLVMIFGSEDSYARKGFVAGGIIVIAVGILCCFGIHWYMTNSEAGKRALKTQESNLNGGITRQVEVYDMNGDLLEQFVGKFDVSCSEDRILFDDENGNRHTIYYKSGTVIINEVDDNEN